MTTFEPRAMDRDRGQVLYRFRPGQTFDHVGGFTAQVRAYGSDDAFEGPALDRDYLVAEAMRFVRRWRSDGRDASGAQSGSDRAPEFPEEVALAESQYEILIPGRVLCRVWPRVVRCPRPACHRVWEAGEPRPGDTWPERCPSCRSDDGIRQLQYVFVHSCGEIVPMQPPDHCTGCGGMAFKLDDRASRFRDFRWECMRCHAAAPVQAFCPNRSGCHWTDKMMAPQVHTASAAYAAQGTTIVNPPTVEHARRRSTPEFVVASLGRWLHECTPDEAEQLIEGAGADVPAEVLEAIKAMEAGGLHDQAAALRRRFLPVDIDDLRGRVTDRLGFDPLADPVRGPQLAANLDVYERVLSLPRLTIGELESIDAPAGRASIYREYRQILRTSGFDPDHVFLVKEFPITYLAVGYCRGGFEPRDADLVAYKGRSGRGQALRTLLYAHPTETEALVFTLDHDRVARWLVANGVVAHEELAEVGGVARWLGAHMHSYDGRLPPPWDPNRPLEADDPEYGPQILFRLLHSVSHQMLRGLAVDSGFQETALSEYLFPYALAFAVHPNGGSEFTIGGLRTVLEQNLGELVARAVANDTCIYDPHCMVANRGSDHGCLQLPETACQSWNWFLSRWELFGDPDGRVVGYWSPELDTPAT